MICECCGSTEIKKEMIATSFVYGNAQNTVDLNVTLPVYSCSSCGFEYTDDEAETIKQRAIYRYLELLSPIEIKAIREKYNFTQREFCEVSGIGIASLARWESGKLIHNKAYDNLLYLLNSPNNLAQLQNRKIKTDVKTGNFQQKFKYVKLESELIQTRMAQFEI